MSTVLDLTRSNVAGAITVRNSRERNLPLEIVVLKRIIRPDGTEFMESTENFVVFPPMLSLEPNESQTIRFQYVGPSDISNSERYLIDVREVPAQPEDFTGVLVVYNIGAAVRVRASGAMPDISILNADRDAENPDTVLLTVQNRGRGFGYLDRGTLTLQVGDSEYELDGAALTDLLSQTIIAPSMTQSVSVRLEGAPSGEASASWSYRSVR